MPKQADSCAQKRVITSAKARDYRAIAVAARSKALAHALEWEGFHLRLRRVRCHHCDFSLPAPEPVPVTITPHLVVLVRCRDDHSGQGTLETSFRDASGKEVARNAQPLQVEPGKFRYSLVRGELTYEEYGTIEAHCRIDAGHTTIVPLTLLPPVESVD